MTVSLRTEAPYQLLVRSLPNGPAVAVSDSDELHALIRELVVEGWVQEVVAEECADATWLRQLAEIARMAGRGLRVSGEFHPEDLPPAAAGEEWVSDAGDWLLRRRPRPLLARALKRGVDIAGSVLGLILASPLLLLLAIFVKLDSRGPVFYEWKVLGKDGRPFSGYKFRSMVVGADALKAQLLAANEMSGPVFKLRDDPRITRVGRFLRKYSLDELPQLWSVLKGDMSLVGPRPPAPHEYRGFELWQVRKLSVTPGITCLWQVNGRNLINDFSEWAQLDLEYIDSWSLGLDLKILLRTVGAVFRGTGR